MREFHPWPIVKISPQTAKEYDMSEGEWIWIENTEGRCKQKVHIDPVLDPHYIHAEHGWWYPEQEPAFPHLYGAFDSNINNLTTSFETGQGGIGNPLKAPVCKIYKVTAENAEPTPGEVVTEMNGFRDDYVAGEPYAWTHDNTTREGGRF